MYVMNKFIDSTLVDKFFELKLSALFQIMQEASSNNLEQLQMGKKNTVDVGMYWVITRYDVKIVRMPKYLETITIKHYFSNAQKFMYNHNIQIEDNLGNILVKASSIWCILSYETHRPVKNPFPEIEVETEHLNEELPEPKKIMDSDLKPIETRKIKYSDLDLHGHVNNCKYIEYIIDSHDEEFYNQYKISDFSINYMNELTSHDVITIKSDGLFPETISAFANDKESFRAKIEYIER